MRLTWGKALVLMAAAAVAIAGCGDDEGDESTAEPTPDLARPLLATCGTEGFQEAKPERHLQEGQLSGWQFSYRVKFVDSEDPGATTTILLIEESPELPARGVTGGHPVTVDGQEVSLRTTTKPEPRHFAQWLTEKARYIAISDGDTPARLKRLIACLP